MSEQMLFARKFFVVAAVAAVFAMESSGQVQAPLTIDNVTDRSTASLQTWFRVPVTTGYIYRVLLDGRAVPTEVTNWVTTPDYHELYVSRTNLSTGEVTNRLIRFIVQSERGNPEKGLIRWTPYPPIPSTAAELAKARMRIVAPAVYPMGLPLPVVVWIEDEQGRARRVNGWVTAPEFPGHRIQILRGVGSGYLPAATQAGNLSYTATLPGLETNRQIVIENSTSWTVRSGVLASSEVWPANSRIHLTAGLTIPANVTLTIGAGTVVKLEPLVNITNNGRLVIEGTEAQPVVFTATNANQVLPEVRAGAWGGFVMSGSSSVLEATGAIFAGGAGAASWSFGSGSSHRSEQPLLFLQASSAARLTNCAVINCAGQVGNGYNAELTLEHTLFQRAITAGEYVGGVITINHSALIEFPNDDGVVDAQIADADYDGIYFTTGTHVLMNSLFGFAKDDAIDSGSGGAGTVYVTNCWVESALHEAHAWSGQGRVASSYDTVLINCGQGIENGWTTGANGAPIPTSPDCFAERLLTTANSVGARTGDNYDWSYQGFLRLTNSLILYNYRDVFAKTWNTTGQGWDTNQWVDRLAQMDLRSNYLTQADARFPSNSVWDPARDGWRLAHWMSTPPDAPVGIGLAVRTNQLPMAALLEGVPVRLSSFTTNFVSVEYVFRSGGSPVAGGSLSFSPGETLKRIPVPDLGQPPPALVEVVLQNPVRGELTGLTNLTYQGTLPVPAVGLAVGTNQYAAARLTEGVFVMLNTQALSTVSVDYQFEANQVVVQSGRVTFVPGETLQRIVLTNGPPPDATQLHLTVGNAQGASLTGVTSVTYTVPPLIVGFGVSGSQRSLDLLAAGLPVSLGGSFAPAGMQVSFRVEDGGGVLTNGVLVFSGGESGAQLLFPTLTGSAWNLIRVKLEQTTHGQLGGITEVYYVKTELAPPSTNTTLLIRSGDIWRYRDLASAAPAGWNLIDFDDSSWSNGCTQLGFGDGDECRVIGNNGEKTAYFRRKFVVENPAAYSALAIRLLRDDGGVVYLNGVELFRSSSMPPAPTAITYDTWANYNLSSAPPDNTVETATVSAGALVAGTNVLAVEIHQYNATSSDISFDFELTGINAPPLIPQSVYFGRFDSRLAIGWGDMSYRLFQATNLSGPWTLAGTNSPVLLLPTEPHRYFRLEK